MISIKHRLVSLAFAAAAVLFAGPSLAVTLNYSFGVPLNDTSPAAPASPFATLSIDTSTWTFTLNSLSSLNDFGSTAFLSSLAVDGIGSNYSITNVSSGSGVTVQYKNGGGPGGAFDFLSSFPTKNSDRMLANEWVQWTVVGLSSINALGLHVQSIGANKTSGWYGPGVTPTPVPLPAAIWLLGPSLLGLLGLTRRKRQTALPV